MWPGHLRTMLPFLDSTSALSFDRRGIPEHNGSHDKHGRGKMIHHTVGIDISKAHLDAFAAPEGRAARFSNDTAGFRKPIARIGPGAGRVACEPTGPFRRDLEDALLKAGLPLYSINPYQARCFARSRGRRAKTGAADARTLAAMAGAIDDLRPTLAKSESQRDLAELKLVRDALIKDRTRTLNRGKHLRHALAKRVNKERLAQTERQLKRIDAEIAKLLRSGETLKRRSEIPTSIPGISSVTAAGLIAHMPELGTMTGPQAASLAGLAPVGRSRSTTTRRPLGVAWRMASTKRCWTAWSCKRSLIGKGSTSSMYLMVDAKYTWWDCGKSYLCRIIDMLHMGYVDEVLFGREVVERIPALAASWAAAYRERDSRRAQ